MLIIKSSTQLTNVVVFFRDSIAASASVDPAAVGSNDSLASSASNLSSAVTSTTPREAEVIYLTHRASIVPGSEADTKLIPRGEAGGHG